MTYAQLPMIRIGCPMWTHPQWQHSFFAPQTANKQHLHYYAQFYTSVEGNSTFYALPKIETVQQWADCTQSDFKFCFKLPQQITHQQQLKNSQFEIDAFLSLLQPIMTRNKLAAIQIQLPPYFSANQLNDLNCVLAQYASQIPLAVEVRHADFFNKGETEKALNQMLMHYSVDRIMMDTRPVHSQLPTTNAIKDAQNKKPKVPVHVLATGNQPIVRYVGQTDLTANQAFIRPWLKHFKAWLDQGKTPILFIHTADNAKVHALTRLWLEMLETELGYYPAQYTQFPCEKAESEKAQPSLF